MCVIISLSPSQSLDFDKLDNAVANNSHGYGVILRDDNAKLIEVRKGFNADGIDAEEVARILEDNKDITRHLHLRNQTKGALDENNVHPFSVYNSNSRQAYVAHNGTLPQKYCPKVGDDRSDTRVFAEDFLSELLLRFSGDFGHGDYNHPLIRSIIEETVGYQNKILIVSNDLDPLYCNHWSTIKNSDGTTFKASNDMYFDKIVRGPRHKVTPFRHTTTVTQANRPPYGTNLKTNESGGAAASGIENTTGTNNTTGGALTLVPRSLNSGTEQKAEEAATTTGTALVNEAKSSRVLVALKDVEDYSKPMAYAPPKALLQALGTSEKMFNDFGFDALCWISDYELQQALKSISPYALSELFRNLIEASSGLAEDVDVAQGRIEQLEREVAILEGKHAAATRMIAELKQKNTQEELSMRKVG